MRICVITYYYKVVVGSGSQFCTLLEVWVLGVGMSLGAQTALYAEDRGLQVPIGLEHGGCLFRSYDLLDWSTLSLSDNKTHTHNRTVSPSFEGH